MQNGYQTYQCKIIGATPLLCHNGMLADPTNEITRMMKPISGKRDKTESDYLELSRLEWHGGLYLTDGKPCIPGEVIEACLMEAARKRKKGKQAQAGIIVPDDALIQYDGPNDPAAMWESGDFIHKVGVKVQRNKVIRTRPIFKKWALDLEVLYLDSLLNRSEVEAFVQIAGQIIGLGDWRPKFGRFSVQTA
jgi:hypothetical protein